ncbi:putative mitochondrial 37S ribosomal protein S27 [Aspergillus heteromorphus CBS 117.55]|uniref:Small ribosomal subunit protein mS33 n=1 Tax=Aspergillus heteromorphus CBS 117.55 TaxID=1448321 RepID=A0A317V574_9EURO|nr:putative mitochondrial 37S ribosomal protein S27 [Aspergillus heteromorphus CBS 117.55]PWY68037.1 putative mitochondrial 37S ribosomal protein S27 [Aspergillus heteromorphus CBS 117.55]
MAAPTGRLLDLLKVQCRIFSLNFNPERQRLGNKILRQRLRGPAHAAWYPKKTVSFRDLQEQYKHSGLTMFDECEDDREESIQIAKLRGKGRPAKKRTAPDHRASKKK